MKEEFEVYIKNGSINIASIDFEVGVVFSSVSMLSLLTLCILSLFQSKTQKSFITHSTLALVGFTTIASVIGHLNHRKDNLEQYVGYVSAVIICIGCMYHVFGAFMFFDIRRSNSDMKALGHRNCNISIFILIITLILVVLEVFMTVGCYTKRKTTGKFLWFLIPMGTVQKGLQASIYHFVLKDKIPRKGKFVNACWFLIISALFNLSMWLESIILAETEGEICIQAGFGEGSSIFSAIYSALMVDYRLVCFFLFMEHILAITIFLFRETRNQDDTTTNHRVSLSSLSTHEQSSMYRSFEENEEFRSINKGYSGMGCALGAILFILQFTNGLQYKKIYLAWTNFFGMLPDLATMFSTIMLLREMKLFSTNQPYNALDEENEESADDNKEDAASHGIAILVIMMGTVSTLYWILKTSIGFICCFRVYKVVGHMWKYFAWGGVKYFIRIVSSLFQVILFIQVRNDSYLHQKCISNKNIIYFILPFISISFFAVFCNSIIDSFNSIGEMMFHRTNLVTVLLVLYNSGQPIHLGFCLHMTIHFGLMFSKLKKREKVVINQGYYDGDQYNDREDGYESNDEKVVHLLTQPFNNTLST